MERSKLEDQISVSIRALPNKAIGACGLCNTEGELPFWDSDPAGRICQECAPFLRAVEVLLVGAKCGHFADFLILTSRDRSRPDARCRSPHALDLLRELLDQGLERAVQSLKINDRLALLYARTTSVVATLHISGLRHVLNSQP